MKKLFATPSTFKINKKLLTPNKFNLQFAELLFINLNKNHLKEVPAIKWIIILLIYNMQLRLTYLEWLSLLILYNVSSIKFRCLTFLLFFAIITVEVVQHILKLEVTYFAFTKGISKSSVTQSKSGFLPICNTIHKYASEADIPAKIIWRTKRLK